MLETYIKLKRRKAELLGDVFLEAKMKSPSGDSPESLPGRWLRKSGAVGKVETPRTCCLS